VNYFEFYGGDYMRDTAQLTLAEHGAYLLLLATYYATERPLPADFQSLYRIARAMNTQEQKAVRSVADGFFKVDDDGLRHNPRADRVIADAQPRIAAARGNGSKGGRPKKPKTNPDETQWVNSEKPSGFPVANPAETHSGEALHTPSSSISVENLLPTGEVPTSASDPPDRTLAGEACLLMRAAGIALTNPSHADLLAALAEGLTPIEIADAAREAVERGKNSMAYAIATARGRRRDKPKIRSVTKPSAADNFQGKTYVGTPIDQLPAELRGDAAA